ncbi:MAG: ADP-ribosylglycohydrolase family protein [Planctomycetota bacterium]
MGTAVADSIGLPYEGISPQRALKLFKPPLKQRFVFGRGMISDDTEHACMVAQALVQSGFQQEVFLKCFARRLKWWMVGFPAGVGKATAIAGIRLLLGANPHRSGVFSAGNGPAMRAAIFGAAIDNTALFVEFVRASSRITHTDPRAESSAIAVAMATRFKPPAQKAC